MPQLTPTDEAIGSAESGGNALARNPESSASGKYQFIQKTFEGVQKNNPDLPKVSWQEFQKNPEIQDQYQVALRQENEAVLQRNGFEPTPSNAYLTHYFGAPKGISLLKANETDPITEHLSSEILKKNKLDPKMTVGDLRQQVSQKMDEAMGKPYRVEVVGYNKEENIPNAGQGIRAPNNPFGSITTKEHQSQLDQIDKSLEKIRQFPQGSPDFNKAVADEYKKGFGPNWGNAFLAALFGQKEQALAWITGGRINKPSIAEALVNGQLKRVQINSNERGDQWITDASTGERLPDNTQITSTSPESAIRTSQIGQEAKAGLVPGQGIGGRSIKGASQINDAEIKVGSWTDVMPTNYGLLESIQAGTKEFQKTLDNITQGPEGRSVMAAIKGFLAGSIDENKLKEAAVLAGVQSHEMGRFVQFTRDMKNISQNDNRMKEAHAPGSGTAGDISLDGGAQGIKQWLNRRISDQAMQDAYNTFVLKNRTTANTLAELNDAFNKSAEREAVINMQRRRSQGKSADIVDGAPIADFDTYGRLIVRKYNAKTKRGE